MSKILKYMAGGFVNAISDKNNKVIKKKATNNFIAASVIGSVGYSISKSDYDKLSKFTIDLSDKNFNQIPNENISNIANSVVNWFNTSDYSPLEAINNAIQLGEPHVSVSFLIYMTCGYFAYKATTKEKTLEEKIASYGSGLCPYKSYIVSQNDLKAKGIQMKLNALDNLSNEFDESGLLHKSISGLAKLIENTINKVSPPISRFLSLIKKEEWGFEILSYRIDKYSNPKLVSELPLGKEIKDLIRPETLDIHNDKNTHERDFVQKVRERATRKSQHEIMERNITLAVAKIILNCKKNNEISLEEKEIVKNLKNLSELTSTKNNILYSSVSSLSSFIFANVDIIKDITIPKFDLSKNDGENVYHILKELDNVCRKQLKCTPLRKPMTYREIYRNELIFCIQEKLRAEHSDIALINRMKQIESTMIREHYFSEDETLSEKLNEKGFNIVADKLIINPININMNIQDRINLVNFHKGNLNYNHNIESSNIERSSIEDVKSFLNKFSLIENNENDSYIVNLENHNFQFTKKENSDKIKLAIKKSFSKASNVIAIKNR
jgi:hypothetical protein